MTDEFDLQISPRPRAVRFDVRVRPRAPRSKVLGTKAGALMVAVAAPPVDGEANAEVIAVLAAALHVHLRDVSIVGGKQGRNKIVEVRDLDGGTVVERLARQVRAT